MVRTFRWPAAVTSPSGQVTGASICGGLSRPSALMGTNLRGNAWYGSKDVLGRPGTAYARTSVLAFGPKTASAALRRSRRWSHSALLNISQNRRFFRGTSVGSGRQTRNGSRSMIRPRPVKAKVCGTRSRRPGGFGRMDITQAPGTAMQRLRTMRRDVFDRASRGSTVGHS